MPPRRVSTTPSPPAPSRIPRSDQHRDRHHDAGTSTATSGTRRLRHSAATTGHVGDRGAASRGEDVSGPCDEAEHANDPRCAGGHRRRRPRRRRPLRPRRRRRRRARLGRRRPLRFQQRQGLDPTTNQRRTPMKLILTSLLATTSPPSRSRRSRRARRTAQTVRVTEVSYSIRLSAKPKARDREVPRTQRLRRRPRLLAQGGGKTWRTRVIGETGSASLTAVLKQGVRYAFWCSVGDHREEGMAAASSPARGRRRGRPRSPRGRPALVSRARRA